MSGSRTGAVGLVLAGGKSSRMGGQDKSFLPLAGVPMIERVIGRLREQVSCIVISANGDPERFQALNFPVVADPEPEGGPLFGLLAGMAWAQEHAGATHVAAVACDTPFFPLDLVDRLMDAVRRLPGSIAVARSSGRHHPVFGLFPIVLADHLALWLGRKEDRSVSRWIENHPVVFVDFDTEPDPFLNINTPGDLALADRILLTWSFADGES